MPDFDTDSPNRGPYKPIACSLYDVLESASILKSPLLLTVKDGRQSVLIKDVFAKGREEFLRAEDTETGEEHIVRLDAIRQITDPAAKRTYESNHC